VSVLLSPRNRERAEALAAEFEDARVLGSNLEVVDQSDWVVLAVLPQQAADIVGALRFHEGQRVVSLIGGMDVAEVAGLVGAAAPVVRLVPLPFIARRVGPLAAFPPSPEVERVFGALGDFLQVEDERDFDLIVVVTSLMSPFHALVAEVVAWADGHGLPPELARAYTLSFFEALLGQARHASSAEFPRLWRDEMTPGGLNELTVTSIRQSGGIAAWPDAMDKVLARIRPDH
jgi:pyrroline-5-carboxylate reductase